MASAAAASPPPGLSPYLYVRERESESERGRTGEHKGRATPPSPTSSFSFFLASPRPLLSSAADAASLDADLMDPAGIAYSLDQLMELAGLAVAQATAAVFPLTKAPSSPSILVLAGPGNNGGDGLVAARHLALWGYPVSVCYPRRPASQPHYARLVAQLEAAGVPFVGEAEAEAGVRAAGVVVDALLGFGARGRPRPPLAALVDALRPSASPPPIVAVDIPSGWGVDEEEEGEAGHDDPARLCWSP